MKTNYSSFETFYKTASGAERDALSSYQRSEYFGYIDWMSREEEVREGCRINSLLNDGWAGMTAAELEAEGNKAIDNAIKYYKSLEEEE